MRQSRKSGSVGAPGGQLPGVTRLYLRLAGLARLPEATAEAERPAADELDPASLDEIVARLLTTAARVQASGRTDDAAAGKRPALRLSEHALASPQAGELNPIVRRRLESTRARLYQEGGEGDKALSPSTARSSPPRRRRSRRCSVLCARREANPQRMGVRTFSSAPWTRSA